MKIRFYVHGLCGSLKIPLLERHWYWKGFWWGPTRSDPVTCAFCNERFAEEQVVRLGLY